MGYHRLKIRYHLLNARLALLLRFMQTLGVHQNRAVALQNPAYHKFRNKHAHSLLARKMRVKGRSNPLCKTGLKIQYRDAKNAAPSKKGSTKASLYDGDAHMLHAANDIKFRVRLAVRKACGGRQARMAEDVSHNNCRHGPAITFCNESHQNAHFLVQFAIRW